MRIKISARISVREQQEKKKVLSLLSQRQTDSHIHTLLCEVSLLSVQKPILHLTPVFERHEILMHYSDRESERVKHLMLLLCFPPVLQVAA